MHAAKFGEINPHVGAKFIAGGAADAPLVSSRWSIALHETEIYARMRLINAYNFLFLHRRRIFQREIRGQFARSACDLARDNRDYCSLARASLPTSCQISPEKTPNESPFARGHTGTRHSSEILESDDLRAESLHEIQARRCWLACDFRAFEFQNSPRAPLNFRWQVDNDGNIPIFIRILLRLPLRMMNTENDLGSCDWIGTRWKFGDVKWHFFYIAIEDIFLKIKLCQEDAGDEIFTDRILTLSAEFTFYWMYRTTSDTITQSKYAQK